MCCEVGKSSLHTCFQSGLPERAESPYCTPRQPVKKSYSSFISYPSVITFVLSSFMVRCIPCRDYPNDFLSVFVDEEIDYYQDLSLRCLPYGFPTFLEVTESFIHHDRVTRDKLIDLTWTLPQDIHQQYIPSHEERFPKSRLDSDQDKNDRYCQAVDHQGIKPFSTELQSWDRCQIEHHHYHQKNIKNNCEH